MKEILRTVLDEHKAWPISGALSSAVTVDHARRDSGSLAEFDQGIDCERRFTRGLHDDRAASRQYGTELPSNHGSGEVPAMVGKARD